MHIVHGFKVINYKDNLYFLKTKTALNKSNLDCGSMCFHLESALLFMEQQILVVIEIPRKPSWFS